MTDLSGLFNAGATGCLIYTGSYVGDGSTSQAITGVGFRPKIVLIFRHVSSETTNNLLIKIDQSWGEYALHLYDTLDSLDNRVLSLDADGFTVDDDGADNHPNKNGTTYDFICLGYGTAQNQGALINTGSYTGNGSTSYYITGVGFTPKFVKIWVRNTTPGNTGKIHETTAEIMDDDASKMSSVHVSDAGHEFQDDKIIAFAADGFYVDDDAGDNHPNKSGTVYNYLAIG